FERDGPGRGDEILGVVRRLFFTGPEFVEVVVVRDIVFRCGLLVGAVRPLDDTIQFSGSRASSGSFKQVGELLPTGDSTRGNEQSEKKIPAAHVQALGGDVRVFQIRGSFDYI